MKPIDIPAPLIAPEIPSVDDTGTAGEDDQGKEILRQHKWTGCQQGGSPTDAGSYEWVRYCSVCGVEDTCEDPLPPCPGYSPEIPDSGGKEQR